MNHPEQPSQPAAVADPASDASAATETAGRDHWDGATLLAALKAGSARLAAHREAVDVLNVFPVPDGDTGSNMSLTLRAAVDAGKDAVAAGRAAGEVAAAVAHGALLGARGNSGVILSQILRGFSEGLTGRTEIDGRDLIRALHLARNTAYKAVLRPVEGTLLTVIRGAADRAARLDAPTPLACLTAALAGAESALAETPSLLPILRQAGVVDAGGQGLVHVLTGMLHAARGGAAPDIATNGADIAAAGQTQPGQAMAFLDLLDDAHGDDAFGYCTNFLVHFSPGRAVDLDRCRAELGAMGSSAVIVGDESALKVHLHTLNPGTALEYGLALGELDQIKIDNMERQTGALRAQRAAATGHHQTDPTDLDRATTAVVAVAAGAGLAEALRGMGATAVVPGGQTMNPSVQDLLTAVEAVPHREVLLLPNNPNVVLTANQLPALTSKRVAVVPSRSVPQGLAALSRFTAQDPFAVNLEQMVAALPTVRTIEITTATRDAVIDDIAVVVGQPIGLLDDHLVACGDDPLAVAHQALALAEVATAGLVTIFPGAGVAADEAAALLTELRTRYPELTAETHAGDQPHYRYVIAVEE